MGELKDCPFCGRGAWVVRVPDTRRFRPQCKKCGADLGEFDREADAVAAWNRRALSRSEVPAGCDWTWSDDEFAPMWNGACGIAWSFTEGGPVENECNHCPKCGGRIAIAPPTDSRGAK